MIILNNVRHVLFCKPCTKDNYNWRCYYKHINKTGKKDIHRFFYSEDINGALFHIINTYKNYDIEVLKYQNFYRASVYNKKSDDITYFSSSNDTRLLIDVFNFLQDEYEYK
jgi:hypothetical protein